MDIFQFIISIRGSIYRKVQEPFIRLITIYTKDGIVTDVGITAKVERMKKARRVGLSDERKIVHIENGTKILNPGPYDIQKGCYSLIYYSEKKELKIFKNE